MSLVQYSDSSDDDDGNPGSSPSKLAKPPVPAAGASDLPPLPPEFYNLYTVAPRMSVNDDPSVHGGRVRSTPHVVGNWPTHVFIEWHLSPSEFDLINSLISALDNGPVKRYNNQNTAADTRFKLHSSLFSDLNVQLPLHVSLSRPIILRTEEKANFLKELTGKIENGDIWRFSIRFTSLLWVPNLDRTRWFLILKVSALRPSTYTLSPCLSNLLRACNTTAEQFGQPGLYVNRLHHEYHHQPPTRKTSLFSTVTDDDTVTKELIKEEEEEEGQHTIADEGFHVSIGWSLTEPPGYLQKEMLEAAEGFMGRIREELEVGVEEVKVKIGNLVNVIPLERGVYER